MTLHLHLLLPIHDTAQCLGWGGGGGANIVKNTHYSYTASSSAGSLADFAADATNLHCMPRGSYLEVRTKKNKHFAALLGAC